MILYHHIPILALNQLKAQVADLKTQQISIIHLHAKFPRVYTAVDQSSCHCENLCQHIHGYK